MERFADNEMNVLRPMLSTPVFNAFRDTWIEAGLYKLNAVDS
jgi:hypothetical protein